MAANTIGESIGDHGRTHSFSESPIQVVSSTSEGTMEVASSSDSCKIGKGMAEGIECSHALGISSDDIALVVCACVCVATAEVTSPFPEEGFDVRDIAAAGNVFE